MIQIITMKALSMNIMMMEVETTLRDQQSGLESERMG